MGDMQLELSAESLAQMRAALEELAKRRQELTQALADTERMIIYQQGGIDLMARLLAGQTDRGQ